MLAFQLCPTAPKERTLPSLRSSKSGKSADSAPASAQPKAAAPPPPITALHGPLHGRTTVTKRVGAGLLVCGLVLVLRAPTMGIHHAIPHMKGRKGASIINVEIGRAHV